MLFYWLLSSAFKAQPGRWFIAGLAVALGIALAVAIHTVNRSALSEFSRALDLVNGQASAQIVMPSGEFSDQLYDQIVTLQTELGIRAISPVLERNTAQIRVLGIDIFQAGRVSSSLIPFVSEDQRQELFSDNAIFLSAAALQKLQLSVGDSFALDYEGKRGRFKIAGTVPGAVGQVIAVMDLGTLQWRLGGLGRISRMDVLLLDGKGIEEVANAVQNLNLGVRLISSQERDRRVSNLSRAYRVNLNVLALVALFTGAFLVFTTISFSVLRQQSQLALLSILGASSYWIFSLVLAQAGGIAALGGLLGIGLGLTLAFVLLNVLGGDLGGGYFSVAAPPLEIDPIALFGFWILAITVGLLAAYFPAKAATAGRPTDQLRANSTERALRPVMNHRIALIFSLASLVLAFIPAMNDLPLAAYASIACLLFAGLALIPWLVQYCFSRLANGLSHWQNQPSSLTFAVWRLAQAPASAAGLIAGVVAAMALTVAMVIMVASFRDSMIQWLDQVLPADLYANFKQLNLGDEFQKNPNLLASLERVQGIERYELSVQRKIIFQSDRPEVTLIAKPIQQNRAAQTLPLIGSVYPESFLPSQSALPVVYVSEAMVDLYDWRPGRIQTLPALNEQQGSQKVWVAGIFRDYGRQHGALVIDLASYQKMSGNQQYSGIALWLVNQANPATVLNALRTAIPQFRDQEFINRSDLRALSIKIFDRSFALTYALEITALLVAIFATATGFAGQALLRQKEYALVYYLGQSTAQRTAWITTESGLLLGLAVIWGTLLGLLISQILIHRVNPQSFHWTMDTSVPYLALTTLMLALVGCGIAAALWASKRNLNSTNLITALREEW
ncbi:MAG: ABC transporter permease [Polynucleobacter sp.]|nr:ABC transporter permease [Polynucleobacter sp.]